MSGTPRLTTAMLRALRSIKRHGTTTFAGSRWRTRELLVQRMYITQHPDESYYVLTPKAEGALKRTKP